VCAVRIPWRSVFPPPAARTYIFAGLNGACARLAADGRVALGVKRVDRNFVGRDVAFEIGQGPVGDRVQLDEFLRRIIGGERNVRPALRLLASEARDPACRTFECPVERMNFANLAARLAGFDRIAKAVDAIIRDELFDLAGIRKHDANFDAVLAFGLEQRVERFGEVPPRVEGEDIDRRAARRDGVSDRLILDAEARRKRNRPVNGGANGDNPIFESRQGSELAIEIRGERLLRRGIRISLRLAGSGRGCFE